MDDKGIRFDYSNALVRRPLPNACESVRGYILRIQDLNVVDLFKRDLAHICRSAKALEDLGRHLARDVSGLHNRVCLEIESTQSQPSIRVLEHLLPIDWVSKQVKRICPACLAANGCMHLMWEISLIKSCHEHHCKLVDSCNRCSDQLLWGRGGLFNCHCGFDLRKIEAASLGPSRMELDKLLLACTIGSYSDHKSPNASNSPTTPVLLGTKVRIGKHGLVAMGVITGHVAPNILPYIGFNGQAVNDEEIAGVALRIIHSSLKFLEKAMVTFFHEEALQRRSQNVYRVLYGERQVRCVRLRKLFHLPRSVARTDYVLQTLYPSCDSAYKHYLRLVRSRFSRGESMDHLLYTN